MKKFILSIISVLLLTSCDTDSYQEGSGYYGLSRHHFDGHTYIVGRFNHGCHFIHDPDCVCNAIKLTSF